MKKFLFIFIAFILAFTFEILPFNFFQQDEWHSFGLIQSYGSRYIFLDKPFWDLFSIDRVGARFIMYSLFTLFGASSLPFAFFSALIHTLNSFLVFLLALRVSKNKLLGIIASFFFFFNSLGHQAYSWFGTMTGSATSVTFVLLSLIFYFKFLEKKNFKNLLLSLFLIWVSFLFKESGYFVFFLFPVVWFLYEGKNSIKLFFVKNWPILFYGLLMTVILAKSVIFIPGERANYVAANASGAVVLIGRLLIYPLEGIGQSFFPSQFIFQLARTAAQIFVPSLTPETSDFDLFYTTKMTEGIVIVLSILLVSMFVLFFKKYLKNKEIRLFFIFSILFLYLSFLPYVVLDRFDAYLDSRYYYMGLVGSSYVFSIIAITIFIHIKRNLNKGIFIGIMCLIFLSHVFFLESDLFSLAKVSSERKSILTQIQNYVPNLNKKKVFFITGNSPGYYGIPELKVPFQSGLGQVLIVVYGIKGEINPELFKEKTLSKTLDAGFLYDTLAQGYKEIKGKGFGYYYDKKALEEALNKKLFNKSSVISLFYNSDEKRISRKNLDEINL